MSYNPETGLVYIPTMVFPVAFLTPTQDQDRLPQQGKWNVGFDRIANAPPAISEKELAAAIDRDFSGQLVAWDPIQQKARWTGEAGRPAAGGVLSTAGGLVFQPDDHGQMTAYDARSGAKLWSHDTQTGAMAPPITYSIKGEQYVAIAVGFGGGFAAEGGPVAHAWKIANRSRVLVYKLGGEHRLPAVKEDTAMMPKPAPVTAAAEVVEHGKVIYHRHCSYCHGDGLRTGGVNKDLRWSGEGTHKSWQEIVIGGVLSPVGMVSFKDYLSAGDAEAVRQYVLSEANRAYSEK